MNGPKSRSKLKDSYDIYIPRSRYVDAQRASHDAGTPVAQLPLPWSQHAAFTVIFIVIS